MCKCSITSKSSGSASTASSDTHHRTTTHTTNPLVLTSGEHDGTTDQLSIDLTRNELEGSVQSNGTSSSENSADPLVPQGGHQRESFEMEANVNVVSYSLQMEVATIPPV